jgi:hypothetical protein
MDCILPTVGVCIRTDRQNRSNTRRGSPVLGATGTSPSRQHRRTNKGTTRLVTIAKDQTINGEVDGDVGDRRLACVSTANRQPQATNSPTRAHLHTAQADRICAPAIRIKEIKRAGSRGNAARPHQLQDQRTRRSGTLATNLVRFCAVHPSQE